MMTRWIVRVLVASLFFAVSALPVAAQETYDAAAAAEWIATQQQPDGSFAGFGIGSTADAMYALVAAGVEPDDISVGGVTVQDFLAANAEAIAADPGAAAKVVLAQVWSGYNPRDVAGVDLVAAVADAYSETTQLYGADITVHSLSLLALVAAGEEPEADAVTALEAAQLDDGSWSFTGDRSEGSGDTNTTGLALQALIATAGPEAAGVAGAVEYFASQRNSDGGFPYSQTSDFGNASDANSTAMAIQGLLAAGEDLSAAPWSDADGDPLSALAAFQNASGAFRYSEAMADDNQLATYQALPALAELTFLEAPVLEQQPTSEPATTQPTAEQPTSEPATTQPTAEQPTSEPATTQPTTQPTVAPTTTPVASESSNSGVATGVGIAIGVVLFLALGAFVRRRGR